MNISVTAGRQGKAAPESRSLSPDSKTEIGAPRSIGAPIDDGRHAVVVRRDGQEFRPELFTFADVHRMMVYGMSVSSRKRVILWPLGVGQ